MVRGRISENDKNFQIVMIIKIAKKMAKLLEKKKINSWKNDLPKEQTL